MRLCGKRIAGSCRRQFSDCADVNDAENRQTLLYGMGDLHLEVVTSRLLNEYKAGIKLSQPKVAYRETIQKNSDVEYKYKKQSGGHGQYGHVKMKGMERKSVQ